MSPANSAENAIKYFLAANMGECRNAFAKSPCNKLLFVSDGTVFCSISDKKYQYSQGDVVFLRGRDNPVLFTHFSNAAKICVIAFDDGVFSDMAAFMPSEFFDGYAESETPPEVGLCGIQKNKTARDMLLPAIEGKTGDESFLRLTATEVIYDCFVIKTEMPKWLQTPPKWFIEYYMLLSCYYVFTKPFNEIVALAGKSREYISRIFKGATGRNISEHIIDLRVGYACNLLKNSSMDIMGISFECGFENLSTFYHHFSPRVGMPPKEYRNVSRRERENTDLSN